MKSPNEKIRTDPFKMASVGDIEGISSIHDLEVCDRHGKTLLHEACSNGQLLFVFKLLEAGVKHSPRKTNGFTPLHYAAVNGSTEILKLLMDHGASPLAADERGETAFHLAARSGNLEVMKLLFQGCRDNGISQNLIANVPTKNRRTPLHVSARNGHPLILQWLISNKGNLEQPDASGILPIHESAASGHLECLDLLLTDRPSTVNAIDCVSFTPLHHAASAGHLEACKKLLEAGACLESRDIYGSTPLYWAASKGRAVVVASLIGEFGADPNSSNFQRSALHCAAGWGHMPALIVLLEGGANPTIRDSCGLNVLDFLLSMPKERQNAEIVSLFKNHYSL